MPTTLVPVVIGRVVCCLEDILVAPAFNTVEIEVRGWWQEQLAINIKRMQKGSRSLDDSDDSRTNIKDRSSIRSCDLVATWNRFYCQVKIYGCSLVFFGRRIIK